MDTPITHDYKQAFALLRRSLTTTIESLLLQARGLSSNECSGALQQFLDPDADIEALDHPFISVKSISAEGEILGERYGDRPCTYDISALQTGELLKILSCLEEKPMGYIVRPIVKVAAIP